jgi:uncharacterized protein (TIGR02596 family)
MKLPTAFRLFSSAFTLIETLVVVSIVVLILTLTTPTLLSTMQASRLSSSGDTVVGFLSEAQQMSMSQNIPIEVRFFQYTTALSSQNLFRSMQMFKVETPPLSGGGAMTEALTPVGVLTRLPDSIIIPEDVSLSPLLSSGGFPDAKPSGTGTYSGSDQATYSAVRYMPDGSCRQVSAVNGTSLATLIYQSIQDSFLTLCADINQDVTVDNLPKNFYTIQIDPYTGKTRTYRPGQN